MRERAAWSVAALLLAATVPAATAGTSTASLSVGVTVVAACPSGSGQPCPTKAMVEADAQRGTTSATAEQAPIAIVRDAATGIVTFVY